MLHVVHFKVEFCFEVRSENIERSLTTHEPDTIYSPLTKHQNCWQPEGKIMAYVLYRT